MSDKVVSIIIPCYNQAQYLPETLDSVLCQTYQDWECVIVDDGSPDNTKEIAIPYCARDSRIKYFHKQNGGLSSARNYGIEHSIGEYILPLDSDDIIAPTYIEKAVSQLKMHPETKVVTCILQHFGEDDEVSEGKPYCYEDFIWRRFLIPCSAMYRRVDFNKTRGYNSNMKYGMEDFDFWLSLIQREDRVYQIPEILFYYRVKKQSMNMDLQKKLKESYQQVVLNHLDVFSPYFERLFEYPFLQYKISRYENSRLYAVMTKLLRPIVSVRDYIRHKRS